MEESMATSVDASANLIRTAVSSIIEINQVGGTRPAKEFQEVKNKIFGNLPQCQRNFQDLSQKHSGIPEMRLMNLAVAKTALENINGFNNHQDVRLFFQGVCDAYREKISGNPDRAKEILETVNTELCLGVSDNEVAFIKATSPRCPNSLKSQSPYCESKTLLLAQKFQSKNLKVLITS